MLRYYPPEKQGLRHPCLILTLRVFHLRYYPPEKQGLRPETISSSFGTVSPQILSSRKTRIKTTHRPTMRSFLLLRYYPPEKQGLRLFERNTHRPTMRSLRYYPPEKQGLRLLPSGSLPHAENSQILSSRKTRIKTLSLYNAMPSACPLRYYPPEKQGLRP